jgi:hypothetical protein
MMDDDEPEDMLSDSAMDADGLDSQKEHAWGQGANTPSNIPFQSGLYHLYSINTNRTICLPRPVIIYTYCSPPSYTINIALTRGNILE